MSYRWGFETASAGGCGKPRNDSIFRLRASSFQIYSAARSSRTAFSSATRPVPAAGRRRSIGERRNRARYGGHLALGEDSSADAVAPVGDDDVARLLGQLTCFAVVAVADSEYGNTIEFVPKREAAPRLDDFCFLAGPAC